MCLLEASIFSFEKKMGPIENETKRNYEGWKNG